MKPNVIALSETWLSEGDRFSLPGFRITRKDRASRGGGVLLAFSVNLDVQLEQLNSAFEIISCRVRLEGNSSVSIASIYLPPHPFVAQHLALRNCFAQIQSPKFILGDFNAHGVDWGCEHNDNRSQILQSAFDDDHLVTLNTGEFTRVAVPPARCSALDLSACSSSLALWCNWRVINTPCGSDHLPILIEFCKTPQCQTSLLSRPLTKRIQWHYYQTMLAEMLNVAATEHIVYDELIAMIYECAMAAQSVPMPGSTQIKGQPKVWWNDDLQTKYNAKKQHLEYLDEEVGAPNIWRIKTLRRCSDERKTRVKGTVGENTVQR